MYGYYNNGIAYGAGPDMQRRLDMMQQRQVYGQQGYVPQDYSPAGMQPVPAGNSGGIQGRIVMGVEEAKAAQIPLDGTPVYFPSPAERKIYVKSIGLDGMPLFNTYELASSKNNAEPTYADNATVAALQKRVEQLESLLMKGADVNVQSNAVNGNVAEQQ